MFSGQIDSRGPRYCPSVEDKIYRFKDKQRHHIFLEPEGNGINEVYPNGFSTSLPEDVQQKGINSITGLEKAIITKPGYAIEYDYCPSYQTTATLETKLLPGLYFAGQINGTSGYEEAGGLGLVAAINAVLKLENELPFILDRSESYIGVMIDDLITHSTTEPYRMFTSRAEYRLNMREDNARDRLFGYARKYGLISNKDYYEFGDLQKATEDEIRRLREHSVKVSALDGLSDYFIKKERVTMSDLLKVPGISYDDIRPYLNDCKEDSEIISDIVTERASVFIKYEGYIKKQAREVEKFHKDERQAIPSDFPFESLTGLRNEALEKFGRFRPTSLGQAGRIEGVTTGDIAALSIHLKKYNDKQRNLQRRDKQGD